MESSIENSETLRAKILALKSSSGEVYFNEEILTLVMKMRAKETLESMKVLELYYFVMVELVSSLEKFDVVFIEKLVSTNC